MFYIIILDNNNIQNRQSCSLQFCYSCPEWCCLTCVRVHISDARSRVLQALTTFGAVWWAVRAKIGHVKRTFAANSHNNNNTAGPGKRYNFCNHMHTALPMYKRSSRALVVTVVILHRYIQCLNWEKLSRGAQSEGLILQVQYYLTWSRGGICPKSAIPKF